MKIVRIDIHEKLISVSIKERKKLDVFMVDYISSERKNKV